MSEDFMERYRREQAKRVKDAEETLRYVSGALRLMGVREVTATFDGSGDEGWLDDFQFDPPPAAGLPDGLAVVIENAFESLLPGGWEINAGSSGLISLDTATGAVELDQEWREEEEDPGELP